MTTVTLIYKDRVPHGFCVSGHSTANAGDTEGKTVCAAVSSAAYMAANTLLEVIKEKCSVRVEDAEMSLVLGDSPSEKAVAVMAGFFLHITELSKQYTKRIKVITEV